MARHEEEYDVQSENHSTRDFLIGVVFGAVVGAATALFLTPKSGKDMRHNLSSGANNLKEKTVKLSETAVDKGSELVGIAKEKSTSIGQAVTKQSSQLVNKVKGLKPQAEQDATSAGDSDIQRKLEETKRAFDETELQLNQ